MLHTFQESDFETYFFLKSGGVFDFGLLQHRAAMHTLRANVSIQPQIFDRYRSETNPLKDRDFIMELSTRTPPRAL